MSGAPVELSAATAAPSSGSTVPEARQPPLGYVRSLDGVRACAVGAVILLHSGLGVGPGGGLGVDVFFVLSGFLITALLLQEHDSTSRISLRAFYIRRALRLMPALSALVGATVLLSISGALALPPAFDRAPVLRGGAISLAYMTDLAVAFTHLHIGPFFHLWSLAIEEHFYLLWPWLLVAMQARRWSRRRMLQAVVAAMIAIGLWRAAAYVVWGDGGHFRYSFDTQADHLLAGCVLALLLPWLRTAAHDPRFAGRLRGAAVLSTVGLLVLVLVPPAAALMAFGGFVMVYVFAACLVAYLVCGAAPGPFRPLEWRWMVYLGKLSYSLYLWHFVVFHALTASALGVGKSESIVIRVAAAFLVSAASYHLVERYFLRLKPPRPQAAT